MRYWNFLVKTWCEAIIYFALQSACLAGCYYSFIRNKGSDIYSLFTADIPKYNYSKFFSATHAISAMVAVDFKLVFLLLEHFL
jgi:hypothetical protein